MRSLATRDAGSEISQGAARRDRRVQGRGLRPRHRRDLGHRPGRRGDRAAGRRLAVRDDARVRRGSQLEKIDMLDFADFVAINKFDRKGAQDALRDVRKQYQRNRELFKTPPDEMPVYGTIAARFNDDGVTALYQALAAELQPQGLTLCRRRAAQGRDAAVDGSSTRSFRRRACAIWPKSPRRCAAITSGPRAVADRARAAAAARREAMLGATHELWARAVTASSRWPIARPRSSSKRNARRRCRCARRADRRSRREARPALEEAPRHVAEDEGGVRRRRIRREDPRQGNPHRADHDVAVRHEDPQGRAAEVRGRGRDPALAA